MATIDITRRTEARVATAPQGNLVIVSASASWNEGSIFPPQEVGDARVRMQKARKAGGRAIQQHRDDLRRLADQARLEYLSYSAAAEAVEGARVQATSIGEPELAPPALDYCDRGQIENALAAPRAGAYERELYIRLAAKAAVLLYTLAKTQACFTGNKRLAVVLVEAFLALNEMTLELEAGELFERIAGAAESDSDDRGRILSELTDWLEASIVHLNEA